MNRPSSWWEVLGVLLMLAWAFGIGYKTGLGKAWDRAEELRAAKGAVVAFHEALHQCTDSLERVK